MKQKERHWNSFVVAEDRRSSIYFEEGICYKTSLREDVEGDYWELSSYPSPVSWHKHLLFDSLVVCFKSNVGVCIRNNSAQKMRNNNTWLFAWVQGCMCVPLCMQAYACVCLSLLKVCLFVYFVCISARNQVVCRWRLVVCTCVFMFAHVC